MLSNLTGTVLDRNRALYDTILNLAVMMLSKLALKQNFSCNVLPKHEYLAPSKAYELKNGLMVTRNRS